MPGTVVVMKEDPKSWAPEKVRQVELNLRGMERKYRETKDPGLIKGIRVVRTKLRIAKRNSGPSITDFEEKTP